MTADADTIVSPRRHDAAGYRYQHGDRPLDGYTIQRGAGRGGFGEVYYALSDSGREVALKVVHTYEQIELRGIGQCMNLKSPHLVTIFDVKYGDDGRPWVIMEFVSGPSLRELLDAAPAGLGVQKAAFVLREIGKGLTELHDCGIVHRDLKPANIFYENGYVKIGDYGLSKLISASQHSGQTMTVGTVHYMAPEIGAGKYNKQIDIYAMGALLYEMLTGQVPYLGSSPAEVLMKHLNGSVDTSGIEEPFATVIKKAMAKDPEQRYASVQEMVEAVFGSEHVRNSVSQFSADSLTMVAGQAARKISPESDGSFTPSDTPAPFVAYPRVDFGTRFDRMQRHIKDRCDRAEKRARNRWDRASRRWGGAPIPGDPFQRPSLDPLRLGPRIVLGSVVAVMAAITASVLNERNGPETLFYVAVSIGAATAALILGWRLIAPSLRHESPWLTRLVLGGMAGIVSLVLSMPFWRAGGHSHNYGRTPMAILLSLLILDWPSRLTAGRAMRVRAGGIVTAALAGFMVSGMCDGNPILGVAVAVGTALAASLVSGWNPRPNRPASEPRPAGPSPLGAAPIVPPFSPVPVPPMPANPSGGAAPAIAVPQHSRMHKVSSRMRVLWLVLFMAAATLGLMLLAISFFVAPAADGQAAACFAFGCGFSALALLFHRRSTVTQFDSWWSYLFRPLIVIGCAQAILLSVLFMLTQRLDDGETAVAIFWTIFPVVVLFVLIHYRNRGGSMSYASTPAFSMPPSQPGAASISLLGIGAGLLRFVSLLAGLIVLAAAMLLTVAVVSNLPGLWSTDVVDPNYARELARQFGTRQWPLLMRQIGIAVDLVLAFVATGLLLLPRRGAGAAHMFRGLLAIALALGAAVAFGGALPDWSNFILGATPGATIETVVQSIRLPGVLVAAGMIVLAGFVFLWPPRARRNRAAAA